MATTVEPVGSVRRTDPHDAPTEAGLRALLDVLYGSRGERLRATWRNRRQLAHIVKRSLGR